MRTNLFVIALFAIPFILLACLLPSISGAFIFSGVFSLFMYINLVISAKVNARIGGDDGMEKNSFYRFLFILLFSISAGVVLGI